MPINRTLAAALLAAISIVPGASAQAADCALKEIVSLPVTKMPNKDHTGFFYTVPVTIKGVPVRMALDPSFPGTIIDQDFVDRLHLYTRMLSVRAYFAGQATGAQVQLSDLRIGPAQDRDAAATVLADPLAPGVDGALGEDVLSHFDLELNLRAGWAKLFFQDHCPGQVVYWGRPYTVLDLQSGKLGQQHFNVRLNGQDLVAEAFLANDWDQMGMDDARDIFDLSADSPGVTKHRSQDDKDTYYRYPFSTLSLNGYLLAHPDIQMFPRARGSACRGFPNGCYGADQQLLIGANDLSRMRLYFAYGEKKLYVTDADRAPAAPSSQPAVQSEDQQGGER